MYGVNKETRTGSTGVVAVPGVNYGFDLVKIVAESASSKNSDSKLVIRAYFNNGGFDFNKTIFEVDINQVKESAKNQPRKATFTDKNINLVKGETITPDQAVTLAGREINRQVKEILNKFFNEEDINITGSSWKEFATNVQKFYEANKDKVTNKVNIYLIYNNADYLNPRKYNWIEKAVVNADGTYAPSKLVANSNDKLEKSSPDTETTVENNAEGFGETANVAAGTDNLPF